MQAKEYCLLLSKLLAEAGETLWSNTFDKFYRQLELNANDTDVIKQIRLQYGGMGSLNDIILYKNGAVDVYRCNKLNELRQGLFNEIINIASKGSH